MTAPNPTPPPGFVYRVASPDSRRVHLAASGRLVALCGIECIIIPPSSYAMRWGKACPKCNNLRLRGVTG